MRLMLKMRHQCVTFYAQKMRECAFQAPCGDSGGENSCVRWRANRVQYSLECSTFGHDGVRIEWNSDRFDAFRVGCISFVNISTTSNTAKIKTKCVCCRTAFSKTAGIPTDIHRKWPANASIAAGFVTQCRHSLSISVLTTKRSPSSVLCATRCSVRGVSLETTSVLTSGEALRVCCVQQEFQ